MTQNPRTRLFLLLGLALFMFAACEEEKVLKGSAIDAFIGSDAPSPCANELPFNGDACSLPDGAFCPITISCACTGQRVVSCQCRGGTWSCPDKCFEREPCPVVDVMEDTGAPMDTSMDDTTPQDTTTQDTTTQDTTTQDTTTQDTGQDTQTEPTNCTEAGGTDCFSNADCSGGERCEDIMTSTQTLVCCQTGAAGSAAAGDACSDRNDCASGLCLVDLCTETCTDPSSCPTNMAACDPLTGSTDMWCQPAPEPQNCTEAGGTDCFSNAECAGGERCEDIVTSTQTLVCCQSGAAGAAAAGDSCSNRTDCASGLCLTDLCTETCVDGTSCPGNMATCGALTGSTDMWCQP